MKTLPLVLAVVATVIVTNPVQAQFSSDVPGIPRAFIPYLGSRQSRATVDLTYFNVGNASGSDTLAVAAGLGYGRTWRLNPRWEFGVDLSVFQASFEQFPTPPGGVVSNNMKPMTSGLLLYGLRLGLKFSPYYSLSPQGYGFQTAVGVAFQPSLKPVAAADLQGDSAYTGGLVGSKRSQVSIVGNVPQSVQVLAVASYRSRRIGLDAGLIYESSKLAGNAGGPVPVMYFSGLSPRVSFTYRLLPGFGLGFAWWGNGSPPWRDQVFLDGPKGRTHTIGAVLTFGSTPGAGTDIMIMSPTGSFAKSIRLFLQTRSIF